MIEKNFVHRCTTCKKSVPTCDAVKILFADDVINPMESIPGDTILWCDSHEDRPKEAD